jgi:class 3 adenylate cyclase
MAQVIKFDPQASLPLKAVVVMADLEGFSRFFSQPDVHLYVPRFLNHIFSALNLSFTGGMVTWLDEKEATHGFPRPIHSKFQGDGALYIWEQNEDLNMMEFFCMLDLFQRNYKKIIANCIEDIPVADVPKRIRFGVAAGSVYKLTYEDGSGTEYIGYAINLASRLQKYCREFGFIASARVDLRSKDLKELGYVRVVAKELKGFPREIVIVDKREFGALNEARKASLFEPSNSDDASKPKSKVGK